MIFNAIFFSLWFFAPAGLANVLAFAAGKIGFLKKYSYPLDGYATLRGKRILGDHKTVRGLVVGIIAGIVACYIEVLVYGNVFSIRESLPIDYYTINPVILGALLGSGAIIGDSVKSFFKRRVNIAPGRSWFPFDQVDYIFGGLILSWFYTKLSFVDYLLIFIVWFLIHPLVTCIGYLFRLRHKPI